MSPRIGRPPSANPKQERTEIRLTKEDKEILEYCCKVTGKSKSDIVREGIYEVYAKLDKSDKK
ncbi:MULTISPECIES: ribbon-helix-helix domain-containing protein [Oscillospiraceae]|uniref:ribbon-helix-helix protein, CopG family n=1 Tax=Oscillospiraceae TaxID=216572 RepID=UPI0009A6969D|nr:MULTISPECIES: ribbon-helix-helix domain-containing protein [Oscillospiraceae]RGB68998.1 ribbon-helix-helix protein, CopG family [Harryflintia acetispora]